MSRITRHLTSLCTLPPDKLLPGLRAVEKNRERFPGLPHAYPSSVVSPDSIHVLVEEY